MPHVIKMSEQNRYKMCKGVYNLRFPFFENAEALSNSLKTMPLEQNREEVTTRAVVVKDFWKHLFYNYLIKDGVVREETK